MAAPKRRRIMDKTSEEVEFISSEGEKDDDSMLYGSEDSDDFAEEEIQVDFEAQAPVDSDFYGIKQLLQQLFLKAHLNTSQLTELILKQNYIGSVLKQTDVEAYDSDSDDDNNETFGLVTVLNITDKKENECIQQLNELLLKECTAHSTSKNIEHLHRLLNDNSKPIGFLISERLINIPAKVSVPMYESLIKEIDDALKKKMPFNFEYFLIISKTYKTLAKDLNKSNDILYFTNPEEEYFLEEAILKFEYLIASDNTVGGRWDVDDEVMIPSRTVMVLPASKLEELVEKLKEAVA